MHPDTDDLALLAMGESPDAATAEHVAGCARCAAEVAALAQVVDAGRLGTLVEPPERVWRAVADAVAESGPETEAVDGGHAEPRHGRTLTRLLAVAAASALVGAGGVLAVQQLGEPEATTLASADLLALPGWDVTGVAVVEEVDDQRELVVRLPEQPVTGFRQVWLASPDLSRLLSLGVLTGTEGTFTLPDDLDLTQYTVVDVSAEPADGDPAHSGVSVVRGDLDA